MGQMILTVLGMVAEMEVGFIRERQRAGIEAANSTRAAGRVRSRQDRRLEKGRAGSHGDRKGHGL
jgi:DNA invertase Pin-like site-specific DNA recombinase